VSGGRERVGDAVEALRQAFDGSFAAAPHGAAADEVSLLAIRVGGEPVALRVHDTAGLLVVGRIVALPSHRPELLGITGVRGAVVPVFSLARLTGRSDADSPRWVALAGGADRIGLAFATFEGHLRVPATSIHAAAPAGPERASLSGIADVPPAPRPILDLPAIVRAVVASLDRRNE
jgi:chemotaxis signal transduction protein